MSDTPERIPPQGGSSTAPAIRPLGPEDIKQACSSTAPADLPRMGGLIDARAPTGSGEGRRPVSPHVLVSPVTAGSIIPHQYEAMAEEVRRLRELVRECQWAATRNGYACCPVCMERELDGHSRTCRLAALRG